MADQVMARVHRLGQEREVHVSRLCAAASIEDFLIHDLLPQKNHMIQDKFMASGGDALDEKSDVDVDDHENENENDGDDDEYGDVDGDDSLANKEDNLDDILGTLAAIEAHVGGEERGGESEEDVTPKVESIAMGVTRYWSSHGGLCGLGMMEANTDAKPTPLPVKPDLHVHVDEKPTFKTESKVGVNVKNEVFVKFKGFEGSEADELGLSTQSGAAPCTLVKLEKKRSISDSNEASGEKGGEGKEICHGSDGGNQFGVPYALPGEARQTLLMTSVCEVKVKVEREVQLQLLPPRSTTMMLDLSNDDDDV
jgi:hypothetical protein